MNVNLGIGIGHFGDSGIAQMYGMVGILLAAEQRPVYSNNDETDLSPIGATRSSD